jgi:hypothetical protein
VRSFRSAHELWSAIGVHEFAPRFRSLLPAVLLAACGSKQPPADDVRVVRTTTVTTDDGANRSDYSGEVRAREEIRAARQLQVEHCSSRSMT